MKVVQCRKTELVNAELPLPEPQTGEVRVRIAATGICQTDVFFRDHRHETIGDYDAILGHEIAGVVDKVGDGCEFEVGERVCIDYLIACGECRACQDDSKMFCTGGNVGGIIPSVGFPDLGGGFAEYTLIPERCLHRVPDNVELDHAACMMCAGATAMHAIRKSRLGDGETVAIFGVGGVGACAVQLAFIYGASKVIAVDLSDEKLKVAESFGAKGINPGNEDVLEKIQQLTDGRGVDIALECVGIPVTMTQAASVLAVRGRAVFVGVPHGPLELPPEAHPLYGEKELIGCCDHTQGEIDELLQLAANGKFSMDKIVVDDVPLDADTIGKRMDNMARSLGRTVVRPMANGEGSVS